MIIAPRQQPTGNLERQLIVEHRRKFCSSLMQAICMSGRCVLCGRQSRLVAGNLGLCVECIRTKPAESMPFISKAHKKARASFGLRVTQPRDEKGILCNVCSHECRIGDGEVGYCGLRRNIKGKLTSSVSSEKAFLHAYLDPQVTNCCATWFCPAGTGAGYPKYAYHDGPERGYFNLALFFYGCNFNYFFSRWTGRYFQSL